MNNELPPHQQPELGDGVHGWDRPLGLLLREARQKKELGTAEVGQRLRLTSAIVDAIERDDFDRLGASIYVRGYLTSYARLVGVPTEYVDRTLNAHCQPAPPLQSANHTPRWQFLYDRYAKRVMYVALTGVIVFPIVLMGLRDRLPIDPPRMLSLDRVATDESAASTDSSPVAASLAPFYREPVSTRSVSLPEDPESRMPDAVAPATLDVPGLAATAGEDTAIPAASDAASPSKLSLTFNGSSWIEVLSRDGRRLAYGLIAAGEVRSFNADEVGRVAIGDADAVAVSLDGRGLNLAGFRHAKVARFALSSAGEPVVPGG